MSRSSDILFMAEYIKDVLYFATIRPGKVPKNSIDTHYFCIDTLLLYENYYSDFGPLNLGCVYKYCKIVNEKIEECLNKQIIVHYTSTDSKKKTNAAFLLGCYGVLYLSLPPKDALKPLMIHGQTYRAFQDATPGDSPYTISLLDCLQAINKARELGFFNFQDFNYESYVTLDKIQSGDLNWIVPGKFLAFIGPVDKYRDSLYHPPEMYINYFKENNVKIVIRLNKKLYDANVFMNVGIMHYDLFFYDGTCPPQHILYKFLQISEESEGAIAVHCKAGLGRTGSLIGCYLMKHYRMTAHEAIGWMRICRPGSVIGQQQEWLEQHEAWLIKQGNIYRRRKYQDVNRLPIHEFGVYSINEKAVKHRPVIFSKSPSPPPPVQRQNRADIQPILRPQVSKNREAFNTTSEKAQYDGRLKSPNIYNNQRNQCREYDNNSKDGSECSRSRRSSASGDPRSLRCSVRGYTTSYGQQNSLNTNDFMKIRSGLAPVPMFCTTQGPIVKTINEARSFLLRANAIKEQRERQLLSTVTTPTSYKTTNFIHESLNSGKNNRQIPLYCSTAATSQPQYRRRLGRSPSPPTARAVTEQTRATNTPSPVEIHLKRDTSKLAIRDALSRLKLSVPRYGSVGAGSVGAASLGARRDAPTPKRAPSVRSDERSTATQGDMLNSIKFQRRLREKLQSEKEKTNSDSSTVPKKTNSKNGNSGTNIVTKTGRYRELSIASKDRISSKGLFNNSRPSSPKGRRNMQPFY